jgi:hypothetical protein
MRYYTAPDGAKYPLYEAQWDTAFTIYRSDRRKAVAGDPHNCLLALGIKRNRDVLDVYIGAGQDAYVVFKARGDDPARAVHFTITSSARRSIDGWDGPDKRAATMTIKLKRPTAKRTLEARSKLDKDRAARIKNGTHKVRHTGKARLPRVTRFGAVHRPPVEISRSGNVSAAAA